MNKKIFTIELGAEVKDKITGFSGIVVLRAEHLFGCATYGIAPKVLADGKKGETEWFDEGRIEVIGKGISAKSVQVEKKGSEFREHPKG